MSIYCPYLKRTQAMNESPDLCLMDGAICVLEQGDQPCEFAIKEDDEEEDHA